MQDLIIIGAGSVGGHVASNIKNYSDEYNILGFLDDNLNKQGCDFVGFPVLGPINNITRFDRKVCIVVGIAFPLIKEIIIKKIYKLGFNNFPTLISNNSWISDRVKIGKGCIIYPGCTINYNTIIDDFVVMNMNCAIGHDCLIQSFTSLSPTVSLGGNSSLGGKVQMGIGSSTIQGVAIGANVIVGGQSIIIKNVPIGQKIVGNPGRVLREQLDKNLEKSEKAIIQGKVISIV